METRDKEVAMKKMAMATMVLVLMASVLILSPVLYAGQPARDTGGKSTISKDGAVWGFCGRACAGNKDSAVTSPRGTARAPQTRVPSGSEDPVNYGQYLKSLLKNLGFSSEGAVWGFCGRSCSGS